MYNSTCDFNFETICSEITNQCGNACVGSIDFAVSPTKCTSEFYDADDFIGRSSCEIPASTLAELEEACTSQYTSMCPPDKDARNCIQVNETILDVNYYNYSCVNYYRVKSDDNNGDRLLMGVLEALEIIGIVIAVLVALALIIFVIRIAMGAVFGSKLLQEPAKKPAKSYVDMYHLEGSIRRKQYSDVESNSL